MKKDDSQKILRKQFNKISNKKAKVIDLIKFSSFNVTIRLSQHELLYTKAQRIAPPSGTLSVLYLVLIFIQKTTPLYVRVLAIFITLKHITLYLLKCGRLIPSNTQREY